MENFRIKIIFFAVISLTFNTLAFTQVERRDVREGNKRYAAKEYDAAQKKYEEALTKNPQQDKLYNNIGAAQFRKGKFENSATTYESVLQHADDGRSQAESYYNLGNSYLQMGEYDKSVAAYRNALRLDPTHDKSRYNMSVATKIKQEQQQQQGQDQQQGDGQGDKQQQQQQQDSQQNKDGQQQEQEQQQQQNQQVQEQEQQSGAQDEMKRDEIERYLESLQEKEKDVQEKVNKERFKARRRKVDKEW